MILLKFWRYVALVVGVLLAWMLGLAVADYKMTVAFQQLSQGGLLNYNEETFQAYAQSQYDFYFSGANAEDNVLIVILPHEEGVYEFDYLMVAGDHVAKGLRDYLGEGVRVLGDPETPHPPMEKISFI